MAAPLSTATALVIDPVLRAVRASDTQSATTLAAASNVSIVVGGAALLVASNQTVTVNGALNLGGGLLSNGAPYVSSQFSVASTSNVYLATGSNLGLGGKSNPAFALDVAGDINFSGLLRSNGAAYVSSQFSVAATSNVYLAAGSNLGLGGKSNPAYALDVAGDVNFSGILRSNGAAYVSSQWQTASTSNVYLASGSNVGIGKSNPAYTLDVNGTINATAVLVGGLPISSGGGGGSSNYLAANVTTVDTSRAYTMSQAQKLVAASPVASGAFGWSSAIGSNCIIVGSSNALSIFNYSNATYTRGWHQDGAVNYGRSVDMSEDGKMGVAVADTIVFGYVINPIATGGWSRIIVNSSPPDVPMAVAISSSSSGTYHIGVVYPGLKQVDFHSYAGTLDADGALSGTMSAAQSVTIAAASTALGPIKINTDGTMAVVGDPSANRVFVLTRSGSTWSLSATINAPGSISAGDGFGSAVSVKAGRVAIGAPRNTNARGVQSGAVFIYTAGSWTTPVASLTSTDQVSGDLLGSGVALSDSWVVATAPGDTNAAGVNAGAVHLWYRTGTSAWTYMSKGLAADGVTNSGFGGGAVSMLPDASVIAVSAAMNTHAAVNAGAVYVMSAAMTPFQHTGAVASVDTATANGVIQLGQTNAGQVISTPAMSVGTGLTPAYMLDVGGDINFSGILRSNGAPYVGSQWTTSNAAIYLLNSNVGIGKSNVAYALDVAGDVNFTGILRSNGAPYISSQFTTSGSNIYLLNSNVGIGLSNPASALHVAGDVRASNFIGTVAWSNLSGVPTALSNAYSVTTDQTHETFELLQNSTAAVLFAGGSNYTSSSFTTTGGAAMISYAGSGFATSAAGLITATVQLMSGSNAVAGSQRTVSVYSAGIHVPFPVLEFMMPALDAGTYTVQISFSANMSSDANDPHTLRVFVIKKTVTTNVPVWSFMSNLIPVSNVATGSAQASSVDLLQNSSNLAFTAGSNYVSGTFTTTYATTAIVHYAGAGYCVGGAGKISAVVSVYDVGAAATVAGSTRTTTVYSSGGQAAFPALDYTVALPAGGTYRVAIAFSANMASDTNSIHNLNVIMLRDQVQTTYPTYAVQLSNMYFVDSNVGVGTTAPDTRLHVAGNVKVEGGIIYNGSNQALWLPGSTMQWTAMSNVTAAMPAGGVFTVSSQAANYRYVANDVVYSFSVTGTVSTATASNGDLTLSVPTALSSAVYATARIIGDAWATVTVGANTTTYKAYVRSVVGNTAAVAVRYLSGTTDASIAALSQGAVISIQGTATYTAAANNSALSIPSVYIPAAFVQDAAGRVVLNGAGATARGRWDVIESSSSNAALVADATGGAAIAEFRRAGTVVASFSNDGSLLVASGANVDTAAASGALTVGGANAGTVNIGTASSTQTVNIGTGAGVTTINIGAAGDTVNIAGTLTYVNTTNTTVTDKLLTLNKGGAAASGGVSGLEIEEGGAITAYARTTADRTGWELKAPAASNAITINQSSHDPVTVGAASNGLSVSGQQLSLALASSSAAGAMSATDKSNVTSLRTNQITYAYFNLIGGSGDMTTSDFIDFNTFASRITYNSTTKEFTVPDAGLYELSFNAFSGQTPGGYTEVVVYVNGSNTGLRSVTYNNSTYTPLSGLVAVQGLTANAKVQFRLMAGSLHKNQNCYGYIKLVG